MKAVSISYQLFKRYGIPNEGRSFYELSLSLLFYFIPLAFVIESSHWFVSIIAVPLLSFALIRLFIIQHDCGHRSFFKSIKMNTFVGRLVSLLTTIPFDYWRKSHNFHHAHSGVEGLFHAGGILTISTSEYEKSSLPRKIAYLLFRHALILLLLIGPFALIVYYRLPLKSRKEPPTSIKLSDYFLLQINNLFLVGAFCLLGAAVALKLLIAWYIATVVAFAIFYVQHNFDSNYFVDQDDWSSEDASMKGSSFLDLPPPLRWATGNIGYHHVHHLCPRIPFYKLKKAHEQNKALFCSVATVKAREVPYLLSLKFYDKKQQKMITWKEYSQLELEKKKVISEACS